MITLGSVLQRSRVSSLPETPRGVRWCRRQPVMAPWEQPPPHCCPRVPLADTGFGTIYTSDDRGIVYSKSLERHLYTTTGGETDFTNVTSLRGIYITSVLSEGGRPCLHPPCPKLGFCLPRDGIWVLGQGAGGERDPVLGEDALSILPTPSALPPPPPTRQLHPVRDHF